MDTITQARSDLSKVLLVACDQSYWGGPQTNTPDTHNGPITPGTPLDKYLDSSGSGADVFPNTMPNEWNSLGMGQWIVQERFDDPITGFGATLYRKSNTDGSRDFIVAMQGTRGPNFQDWGGNLVYGWDKWISRNTGGGQDLLNTLSGLTNVSKIHFTGQSLGGALAQYALYHYAARLTQQHQADPASPDFDPSKVTLTTFNGLGGIDGLTQNEIGFNPLLIANVNTAHYYVPNDLVSRLGGGHLNGGGNEYVLNFWQTDAQGLVQRHQDLTPITLDSVAAHQIETGFYGGFNRAQATLHNGDRSNEFPIDFSEAMAQTIQNLAIGELARTGTYEIGRAHV